MMKSTAIVTNIVVLWMTPPISFSVIPGLDTSASSKARSKSFSFLGCAPSKLRLSLHCDNAISYSHFSYTRHTFWITGDTTVNNLADLGVPDGFIINGDYTIMQLIKCSYHKFSYNYTYLLWTAGQIKFNYFCCSRELWFIDGSSVCCRHGWSSFY